MTNPLLARVLAGLIVAFAASSASQAVAQADRCVDSPANQTPRAVNNALARFDPSYRQDLPCGSADSVAVAAPQTTSAGVYTFNGAISGSSPLWSATHRVTTDVANVRVEASGRVVSVTRDGARFNVLVDSNATVRTYYGGLASVRVGAGDMVVGGQAIGVVPVSAGVATYSMGRLLPASLFGSSVQTSFAWPNRPQLTLAAPNAQGEIAIWIDGVFVAELNAFGRYRAAFDGLSAGEHIIVMYATGQPFPTGREIEVWQDGVRRAGSLWTGRSTHRFRLTIGGAHLTPP